MPKLVSFAVSICVIRLSFIYTRETWAYFMLCNFCVQILRDLGVRTMKLMTNNPAKYIGLKGYGLAVAGRVPLVTPITKDNERYLDTKRAKMGHVYGTDGNGTPTIIKPKNGESSATS